MSKRLITYAYSVLILVSIFPNCIPKVTVNWTLAKKRIVLGSDLQLECRVTVDDRYERSTLKRWTGSSGGKDICTHNKCINEDKYEMQSDQSKPSFNLTIKNVDDRDINERFTCWSGFESSSGTIISQKDIIIFDQAEINKQTSDYIIDGNYVNVNITLDKVYPLPSCNVILEYDDKYIVYSNKSLNTRSSKLASGLYHAEVNGTLELPFTANCYRVLKLTCYFRSVPLIIFAKNSTRCGTQDSKESNERYDIHIRFFGGILVLGALLGLVFVMFYKYCCNGRKRSDKKVSYAAVLTEEIHEEENLQVNGISPKQQNGNKRSPMTTRKRRKDKRRSKTL